MPLTAAGDVLTAPFFDPEYEAGDKSYLNSLASGISSRADRIGVSGREAREKYGPLGVGLQAIHGILNPVSGSFYAAREAGKYLLGKAGEALITQAETAIDKALRK